MKLKLPSKDNSRFVLLGGGYHICKFIEILLDRGFQKPLVITWPSELHSRDKRLLTDSKIYLNIFDYAERFDLNLIETESLNSESVMNELNSNKYNLAFSLSWRYLIKADFINMFNGNVFNLHPTLLPQERGSGTFTYRILNDSKLIAVTIHKIDESFDTGPVLLQFSSELNKSLPIPFDYLVATNELYEKVLNEFLNKIENGEMIDLLPQDESNHTYYARLHTETNGAINWEWSLNEIERFIRAFAYPYPGAFTFVRGKKIALLRAEIVSEKDIFHPYLSGRVISIYEDGTADVIVKDGILKIHEILIDGNSMMPNQLLKPADALFTPYNILYGAKSQIVSVKKMK